MSKTEAAFHCKEKHNQNLSKLIGKDPIRQVQMRLICFTWLLVFFLSAISASEFSFIHRDHQEAWERTARIIDSLETIKSHSFKKPSQFAAYCDWSHSFVIDTTSGTIDRVKLPLQIAEFVKPQDQQLQRFGDAIDRLPEPKSLMLNQLEDLALVEDPRLQIDSVMELLLARSIIEFPSGRINDAIRYLRWGWKFDDFVLRNRYGKQSLRAAAEHHRQMTNVMLAFAPRLAGRNSVLKEFSMSQIEPSQELVSLHLQAYAKTHEQFPDEREAARKTLLVLNELNKTWLF